MQNIRNNLLNWKKLVFPEISFGEFRDLIEIPNGKLLMMFMKRILNYKWILWKFQNLLMKQFISVITSKVCHWLSQSLMSQQQLLQIVTFQKNLIPHVFFQHLKNSLSYAMATHNTILAICLEMQLFVMIASQNFYYLLLHR